jgi:hypothetical protein
MLHRNWNCLHYGDVTTTGTVSSTVTSQRLELSPVRWRHNDWNCLQYGDVTTQQCEQQKPWTTNRLLKGISYHWVSEMCTVHRNRTLSRRYIRNVYYAQKQNTFQTVHQKCVLCTETEHFPDSTYKALFTDLKTTIKNGSQRITYAIKTSMYEFRYAFQFMLCSYVGITNGGGRKASNE